MRNKSESVDAANPELGLVLEHLPCVFAPYPLDLARDVAVTSDVSPMM